jgi:hypothetical protein
VKEILLIIGGVLSVAAIPAIRAGIKSYRAKKGVADVLVDAIEAGVDEIEKKKK